MKEEIKILLEKKKWKGKEWMIVIVILGVLLAVLAIPTEKDQKTEEKTMAEENMTELTGYSPAEYEEELENRLEEILSQMEGVGRVEVMITLESSTREVVEKDMSTQQSSTNNGMDVAGDTSSGKEETTVYSDTDAGSVPYVVQEIYPQVEGVLVVAEGGDDSYVNLAITDAIQALFGVDVHKIKIVKMNTN